MLFAGFPSRRIRPGATKKPRATPTVVGLDADNGASPNMSVEGAAAESMGGGKGERPSITGRSLDSARGRGKASEQKRNQLGGWLSCVLTQFAAR
jgi:hypothetical protein